ncbi:lysozyme inhibitor LprI family protein [Ancylobacter amanitiformis]|uniref:Uncharacterized protein YecT (DUF1311 family) n=1 Tax=Ancylobacter amanitiformis TaxID=217069 RepID=A0ABU0LNW3_9HYPH|nr:lysozyme inhibitor LprI family protein [Ancylobacter amanitiformis]MDQ0510400.1 uncharacterized protein YecT (DUF1311 family) [Ancylobacter amanitiformis]
MHRAAKRRVPGRVPSAHPLSGHVLSGRRLFEHGIAAATLALMLAVSGHSAIAAPEGECVKGKDARSYLDCLNQVQKAGEQRLDQAVAAALAGIEARQELQAPQRRRWIALFNESQSRFVNWRNFECQSIAPYEGGAGEKTVGGRLGGAAVIEQRITCLTSLNDARAADIERRYQIPAHLPPPEPPANSPTAIAAPPASNPPAPAPPTPAAARAASPAPPSGGALPVTAPAEAPRASDTPPGSVRIILP